jgi:hypothetical protein
MALPSFLQSIRAVNSAVADPLGGAASTMLAFTMETQQETEWCWAATTASVSKFYSAGSAWSQCAIASSCLDQSCCTAPMPCNLPYYLESALRTTGNLASDSANSDTFSNVQSEISNDSPVCCHISWAGPEGGGHFVAIYGYDAATQDLDIGDPYYGRSTIPYSVFVSKYQGSGTWDYTYKTCRPGAAV